MSDDSILTSTKKLLGLPDDYTVFDLDVITHINTALSDLTQIGVGPVIGYTISDKTALWSTFLKNDPRLNSAKTYVTLKVRLIFDPPATSFAISAIQDQLKEMLWRLEVAANPAPFVSITDGVVIDPSQTAPNAYLWDLTGLTDFPPEANPGDVGIDYSTGTLWRKV